MITVACVLRKGGKVGYDASWVEKLQNSVTRNLTIPHRFVCFSDCDIPCERIPLQYNGLGFWSKIELFRPGVLTGPVLYIDLDTVICNNFDQVVNQLIDQKFVMLHETDKNVVSSAILWWHGDQSHLWNLWLTKSSTEWKDQYCTMPRYGDQAFIEDNSNHTLLHHYVPLEWIGWSSQRIIDPTIKFLIFRKPSQKPSTMLTHQLVQQHWR